MKILAVLTGLMVIGGSFCSPSQAGFLNWRGRGCCDAAPCSSGGCDTGSGGGCNTGSDCNGAAAAPCVQYETVERTVMVPTMVTETRTVERTRYRAEQREEKYTVMRRVAVPRTETREYWVNVPEERTRTVNYNVARPVYEKRTREYTVQIPERQQREGTRPVWEAYYEDSTRTVMVPERRTRTVNYTVNRPVMATKTVEYTVMVPHQEERESTRTVCEMVPVTRTRTVCEDQGHWEDVPCETVAHGGNGCGNGCDTGCDTGSRSGRRRLFSRIGFRRGGNGCGNDCGSACDTGCNAGGCDTGGCDTGSCDTGGCDTACETPVVTTRRQWVPNIVNREVEYQAFERKVSEVPYTYSETVYRPETRTRQVQECNYVAEDRTREVAYTACVQKEVPCRVKRMKQVEQPYTYYETVLRPETRTQEYTVCKVVNETQTREVSYTEMVPQKRTREVTLTDYRCEPEERTRTCTVMVPYQVSEEVPYRVCKMVPKTITCRVAVNSQAGNCCN